MPRSSEVSGFYKLTVKERLNFVKAFSNLSDDEVNLLQRSGPLPLELADRMVENVVGTMPVPLGIAVNFLINGRDYLVPMATEEPSVIAAASHAAKLCRQSGGFSTSNTGPVMIGQIQVLRVQDPERARHAILESKEDLLTKANLQDQTLVRLGGGARDLSAKVIRTITGPMVVAELLVDCRDAMGANAVNTMCEALAPVIERITGGKVYLRIISNLAVHRLARVRTHVKKEALGEDVVDGVVEAFAFAAADPFRCATHNKGIMNGVIAVALATGNDTRALEAGAHAFAARTGHYSPLTIWEKDRNGDLVGTLEMPMAVGIIGGATTVNPIAKVAVKVLGIKTATELAEVMASVGLAQNLAALKALSTEGIQRGHMSLHARNLAATAGATGSLIDLVAQKMVEEGRIRLERAKELVDELRQ